MEPSENSSLNLKYLVKFWKKKKYFAFFITRLKKKIMFKKKRQTVDRNVCLVV